MDPIYTAMTNAWLNAVARLNAPATDVPHPGPPQDLTEAIEGGLRRGGAPNPGQVIDQQA
jgi:hypothetical protein